MGPIRTVRAMNLWRLSSQESIPDRARSSEGEKWHMPSVKDNGALRSSRADPRETCAEAADPAARSANPTSRRAPLTAFVASILSPIPTPFAIDMILQGGRSSPVFADACLCAPRAHIRMFT